MITDVLVKVFDRGEWLSARAMSDTEILDGHEIPVVWVIVEGEHDMVPWPARDVRSWSDS